MCFEEQFSRYCQFSIVEQGTRLLVSIIGMLKQPEELHNRNY
jgi:hypothetical protein